MTSTNDLMSHPRLTWTRLLDGSVEARFDMRGWGDDITCKYWRHPNPGMSADPWLYQLEPINGKGGTYSHPFEDGCRIMIVRHLVEAGLMGPCEDNSHLDERNQEIANQTAAAYAALPANRPRLGDFVTMPDGSLHRFSYAWPDGPQTSPAGSFYISRSADVSFSGALDGSKPWENFEGTGETRRGRFWFFSHNRAGAGRGVDCYLDCRVYKLNTKEFLL